MMADLHFLRPWWLLTILPLLGLGLILWRQPPKLHAWEEICDSNLLDHLLQRKKQNKHVVHMICFILSVFCGNYTYYDGKIKCKIYLLFFCKLIFIFFARFCS